ncbi:MAG: hypothetical protein AAGF59_01725 [Pseudomonadota bacterium]
MTISEPATAGPSSDTPVRPTVSSNSVAAVAPETSAPTATASGTVSSAATRIEPSATEKKPPAPSRPTPNRPGPTEPQANSATAARPSGADRLAPSTATAVLATQTARVRPVRPSGPTAAPTIAAARPTPSQVSAPPEAANATTSSKPSVVRPSATVSPSVRPDAVTPSSTEGQQVAALTPAEPSEAIQGETPTVSIDPTRFDPSAALRAFDGGACTLVLPQLADASAFRFSAFGVEPGLGERFRRTAELPSALDVAVDATPLARPQCGAVDFVRSLPNYPLFDMRIRLERAIVRDGTELRGIVDNITRRIINLVLIDDDGLVHVVNDYLSVVDGRVLISAPVHLTEAPVDAGQILLAIASDGSLKTLDDQSARPADAFFTELTYETVVSRVRIDVAMAAFRVE